MKLLAYLCFLFSPLAVVAQYDTTYSDLINAANEVNLADSISINNTAWQLNPLDSSAIRRWFSQLLPSTANNRLKNRSYYLAGKITSGNNFDLLIVLEEKKKADSTVSQVVYLVTSKKDGTYIASLDIAVTGTRKKSSFTTSSWLYKDYKIVQDSKITVNQKSYADLKQYRINTAGRFILYPNY